MGKFEVGIISDIIRSDRWDLTGLSIASGVPVKKLREYIACCGDVPLGMLWLSLRHWALIWRIFIQRITGIHDSVSAEPL